VARYPFIRYYQLAANPSSFPESDTAGWMPLWHHNLSVRESDDDPPRKPLVTGARHYVLTCASCGKRQEDDGLVLDCTEAHEPALLQTEYLEPRFSPVRQDKGLFRYRAWMPVAGVQQDVSRTAVYLSHGLGRHLGMPNLWIAFNGYWPERGAFFDTATFKDLEAYTVLGRLPGGPGILTVASSGNTGAAFAWACTRLRVPCLLVVPGKGLQSFRFSVPLDPCVSLAVIDDGDYPDAIALAAEVSRLPSFQLEGGVRNVGRRDGLATVLLSAFEEMQVLPDAYFQAVGSGTGAIAVHEAAKRLRVLEGALTQPRLMLCQNIPFTPIFDAWKLRRRSLARGQSGHFRQAIRQVHADELTNFSPPYSVRGGLYDALAESSGDVLAADNHAARSAAIMFRELEGIDIEPAASVAVACLRDAVLQERIPKDSVVLLNITGGGRARARRDRALVPATPRLRLSLTRPDAVNRLAALCGVSVGSPA
jgi:cysteate synthase